MFLIKSRINKRTIMRVYSSKRCTAAIVKLEPRQLTTIMLGAGGGKSGGQTRDSSNQSLGLRARMQSFGWNLCILLLKGKGGPLSRGPQKLYSMQTRFTNTKPKSPGAKKPFGPRMPPACQVTRIHICALILLLGFVFSHDVAKPLLYLSIY